MQKEPEDPKGEGMAEHLKGEDPQPKTMRHWLFEGALEMQKEPNDPKGKGMAEQKEPKGEQQKQQKTNTMKGAPSLSNTSSLSILADRMSADNRKH